MTTTHRAAALAFAAACLLAFAACSDRDPAPGAASPSPSATRTATSAPTPTPGPGGELAAELASYAGHFVYRVGSGDTVALVADMFDGLPGAPDPAFEAEIRELNELDATVTTLPRGYELAIPLRLPLATDLFQSRTIATAMTGGAAGSALSLYVPGTVVRDAYRGELVLHRIEIEDGNAPGEGRGYYATFARTDRVAIKGGEVDRDAMVVEPAFVTAGGSMAARLVREYPDAFVWRDDDVDYYAHLLADGPMDAGEVATGMEPVRP